MNRPIHVCLILIGMSITVSGCSLADLDTPDRLERGLVIVLPGIEGPSPANFNIARGLDDGGVDVAIRVVNWGTDIPGGFMLNLTDFDRNQRVAEEIRDRILEYKRRYKGRPVHVVGHSGGAGIAILAVERLPKNEPVNHVVLLSAAISPRHDMRAALQRVTGGIHNFSSKLDVGLLGAGTGTFGTIDRDYGASAGAVGFETPIGMYDDERRLRKKLHEVPWTTDLIIEGHTGGHFGWTARNIVAKHVAPVICGFKVSAVTPYATSLVAMRMVPSKSVLSQPVR